MSNRTTTRRFPVSLVLLLALLLAPPAPGRAEIRVVDDRDREVVLEAPARRVVALAPHITESLFAIGAGERLAGTVSYSDHPEAAKSVPRVGSYDKINYESLMAMDPDLVIAWASGNGPEIIARLEELGFTVYASEPRRLGGIARALRHFGTLTGRAQQAAQIAGQFESTLNDLRRQYADKETVSVFYQVWNDPLLTLNGEHMISDVLRLCGGRNVFADGQPLVLNISIESVLRRNPRAIIASGMGDARPDWLDDWKQWPSLEAGRNDNLFFVHPDLLQRHSTRILQGARRICELLDRAR